MANNDDSHQEKTFDFGNFRGFEHPTTTPVPDLLFDHIMQDLNESELKVLLYIIRRTFGFKKKSDDISLSQMVHGIKTKDGRVLDRGTGFSKTTVTRAVRSLKKKNLIEAKRNTDPERGNLPTTYTLKFYPPSPAGETRGVSPVKQGLVPPVKHTTNSNTINSKQQQVVVKKLEEHNIGSDKARRLATKYAEDYIDAKIEFLEWKLELQESDRRRRGRPIEDPAGWLIRAIEKDYQPPPAFKTKAQRQQEAEEIAQQFEEIEQQQQKNQKESNAQHDERAHKLREKYNTSQQETKLWGQVLDEIKLQVPQPTYDMWFKSTKLLSLSEGTAVVCVANGFAREWLQKRLSQKITDTLERVNGHPVDELRFEVLTSAPPPE